MGLGIESKLLADQFLQLLLGNVDLRARLHFADDVEVVFIGREERPDHSPKAKRSLAVHRRVEHSCCPIGYIQ